MSPWGDAGNTEASQTPGGVHGGYREGVEPWHSVPVKQAPSRCVE
jgi:hypothetical protein